MPVKAQQNWIIKSVCLYPITPYLWILDFILYNWQELSGKEGFNGNQIKINWFKWHTEESLSSADELIDGSLWNKSRETVINSYKLPCNITSLPARSQKPNSIERDGLLDYTKQKKNGHWLCIPNTRSFTINLIFKSFIWLKWLCAWKF